MPSNVARTPVFSTVMLAPMAGITDLPFRDLVQGFGAGMVVSEMIASEDMVKVRRGAREKAELGLGKAATAVQLAGRDPYWMGEAARLVEAGGARVIDINMGCPAKKVTGGQSGSALMRDLPLARALIRAVVTAVQVPVTLKCRLGWDDGNHNAADLAQQAESEGISRLVIHGRTRCQFCKGRADWAAIANIVDAVDIPVIANGDIRSLADARQALAASGAAGVMIGRGAQGRPWLVAEVAAGLEGRVPTPRPAGQALGRMAARHYRAMLSFYGTGLGVRVARKHLGWYMDVAATPAALRRRLLTTADPDTVLALIGAAFQTQDRERAA